MKRKFKLLSSIASLSLAVALLVFGVVAYGDKNVSVQGSVSFTATNVSATVKVYEQFAGQSETQKGPVDGFIFTAVLNGEQAPQKETDLLLGDNGTIGLSDTVLTYQYKINVLNTFAENGQSITATFAWAGSAPASAGLTVDVNETTLTLAPGEDDDFIVEVEITNPTLVSSPLNLAIGGSVTLAIAQS